jgi:nucleotidyltransferase/DNA polymerase involved in DNA repair
VVTRKSKRKTVSIDDDQDDTPIRDLVNFGPVTLPEFEAMGIRTLRDLRKLGGEEVCRRWVESFPERLNVNAFIGVIATLDGIPWTKVTASQRAEARGWVERMKVELGVLTRKRRRYGE